MKLYELTQNYNNLLDLMENPEVESEMLIDSISQIEEEFNIKAENICKVIKSIEADIKALKDEETRLANRRKSLESNAKSLKSYLDMSMQATGIDKIKGNVFTISIQNNPPSLKVINENDVPEEYLIIQNPTIDKKRALKDLKEGIVLDWAELSKTKSIRIR